MSQAQETDDDGDIIDVDCLLRAKKVHIGVENESTGNSEAVWLEADAAVRVAEAILEAVKEIRS